MFVFHVVFLQQMFVIRERLYAHPVYWNILTMHGPINVKFNKMYFSFLIYFNILSSACFEYRNYSSSGGSYRICSIWYLPSICVD